MKEKTFILNTDTKVYSIEDFSVSKLGLSAVYTTFVVPERDIASRENYVRQNGYLLGQAISDEEIQKAIKEHMLNEEDEGTSITSGQLRVVRHDPSQYRIRPQLEALRELATQPPLEPPRALTAAASFWGQGEINPEPVQDQSAMANLRQFYAGNASHHD